MISFIVLFVVFVAFAAMQNGRATKAKAIKDHEAKTKLEAAKLSYADVIVKSSFSLAIETVYKQAEDDEEFERWIALKFGEEIDKHFYSRVAGVSFKNKDGVSRQSLILQCKEYDRIGLVPEPDNPYDPNAVRVENESGALLGYLPRNLQLAFGIVQWMAVVRKVNPEAAEIPASLIICLLRKVVVDNSERAIFEREFKSGIGKHSDMHFPSKMDRAYGINEDGSDRQDLIAKCAKNQILCLYREHQNEHDPNSIRVCNESGQLLGYLERRTAAELAPQMDSGRHWSAIVQEVQQSPAGKRKKLHVCVYRLKSEAIPRKTTGV